MTNALVLAHKHSLPHLITSVNGHDFPGEIAIIRGRGGKLVTAKCEFILPLAADAMRLRQEFGRNAHVNRAARCDLIELGVDVQVEVHRQMLHVLQAADDLNIRISRGNRVRRLMQRL